MEKEKLKQQKKDYETSSVRISLKLNKNTDKDIIDVIDKEYNEKNSKQGIVKKYIRKGLEK